MIIGPAIGIGAGGDALGLLPATKTLLAAMSVQPSTARALAYNNIIGALQSPVAGGAAGGLWPLIDEIVIMAAHDIQAGTLDMKTATVKVVANGSPTFTTDQGFTSNGTTSYVDTGFKPSTGVNFTQNSAIIGAWVRTNNLQSTAGMASLDAAAPTTAVTTSFRTAVNDTAAYRINQAAARTLTNGLVTDGSGLTVLHRDGAASTGFIKNGVRIGGTGTDTSVAPVAFNVFLGVQNIAGTPTNFTSNQFAVFVAGGGFGSGTVRDANHLALYNALNNFKWW